MGGNTPATREDVENDLQKCLDGDSAIYAQSEIRMKR
jgi:hypothetical protein